jgi:hypothetical protein
MFAMFNSRGSSVQSIKKVTTEIKLFMNKENVLVVKLEYLLEPLAPLFANLYYKKATLDQWLLAKKIPVFKNKNDKKNIDL